MKPSLVECLEKSRGKAMHRSGLAVFRIDDESNEDRTRMCCHISAQFANQKLDRFILELKRVPRDSEVDKLVNALGGTWSMNNYGTSDLKLNLTSRDYGTINRLALAIRRVVGRGKRYDDSNWKWAAPRAADSLKIFAQELRAYRSS